VLSLRVATLDVSLVVGLAFAVAASSFCPLLVLGIWWRGLTDIGAAAGILAGGGGAVAAVLLTFVSRADSGLGLILLHYPAAWTVPLAFVVMVGVSLATRRRVPGTIASTMLRLHAPEALRPPTP
jgi:Na+(H+)/acetate symporter ActP